MYGAVMSIQDFTFIWMWPWFNTHFLYLWTCWPPFRWMNTIRQLEAYKGLGLVLAYRALSGASSGLCGLAWVPVLPPDQHHVAGAS